MARTLLIDWDQKRLTAMLDGGGKGAKCPCFSIATEMVPNPVMAEELGAYLKEQVKARGWQPTALVALIGRDRSVTFQVENVRQEPVCEGTFTNEGVSAGKFSLSCFSGKFAGSGSYESKTGSPNDHIVARGQTAKGLPVVMVIGLPSQLAAGTYGGI